MEIWQPKYSAAYTDTNERVALLAKYKVDHAGAMILIEFTKAKHLAGQRYCISKENAMQAPIDSNGTIACYAVRMSDLLPWETKDEAREAAFKVFED